MMKTSIGKLELNSLIFNASGPRCISGIQLSDIDNSSSGAVVSKTCTLEKRNGNNGVRYWDNDRLSINSMGLPNLGFEFYGEFSKNIKKPFIISVGGLFLEDNITILNHFSNLEKKVGIELNLSCPNIVGKGQLAYDFDLLEDYLTKIFEEIDVNNFSVFGIKLPPFFELSDYEQVSKKISKFPINFITCVNSIGNGMVVDFKKEKPVIEPKGGLGGIGGSVIKPVGLANVYNFKKLLPNIDIIGCGGIETGTDVFEYLLCGASAVQIGTQFHREGVECFKRIEMEFLTIMKSKGYNSIKEIKLLNYKDNDR